MVTPVFPTFLETARSLHQNTGSRCGPDLRDGNLLNPRRFPLKGVFSPYRFGQILPFAGLHWRMPVVSLAVSVRSARPRARSASASAISAFQAWHRWVSPARCSSSAPLDPSAVESVSGGKVVSRGKVGDLLDSGFFQRCVSVPPGQNQDAFLGRATCSFDILSSCARSWRVCTM